MFSNGNMFLQGHKRHRLSFISQGQVSIFLKKTKRGQVSMTNKLYLLSRFYDVNDIIIYTSRTKKRCMMINFTND